MAHRLKETREAAKMTQKELATKLNVSLRTVSRWENEAGEDGKKIPWLEIADIFGISPDYLAGRTDAPATENKAPPAGEGGGETVIPKEVGAREGVCVLSVFKREEREKLSALCDNYSRLDEIDRAEIRGEINSLIKAALKNAKYAPQKDAKLA